MINKKNKTNKVKTLDIVLIVLAIFLFIFITSTMVIYTIKGWPFDTLITMVLGGSGVELISTALISIAKIRKGVTDDACIDDSIID